MRSLKVILSLLVLIFSMNVTYSQETDTEASGEAKTAANGIDKFFTSLADGVVPGLGTLVSNIAEKKKLNKEETTNLKIELKAAKAKTESIKKEAKSTIENLNNYYQKYSSQISSLNNVFMSTLEVQTRGYELIGIEKAMRTNPPITKEKKEDFISQYQEAAKEIKDNYDEIKTVNINSSDPFFNGYLAILNNNIGSIVKELNSKNLTKGALGDSLKEQQIKKKLKLISEVDLSSFNKSINDLGIQLFQFIQAYNSNVNILKEKSKSALDKFK